MNQEQFVEMVWENFDKFNLTQQGWTFEINPKIYKLQGLCIYNDKLIIFSEKYIQQRTIQENKNLILHEVAHSLVGPNYGHDKVWQEKCILIGGDGRPTSSCQVRNSRAILV